MVRACPGLSLKHQYNKVFLTNTVYPCPILCATIRVKVWDQVWDWRWAS